eukprot:symbB.v1.2.008606.t1/scaffold541.1/size189716/2
MRSLEAQMASFRTRTAALEGEVAQLRAESQGQDEEIRRLRQELQSKEAELQQKDFEVKRLQISAAEQNKTLQSFLRNSFNVAPPVGGSLTLPPGVPALPLGCPSPQRCTTPRVVPTAPAPVPVTMATVPAHMQVYSPSPAVQLRAVGGGETPVLRTPTLTHRAVPVLPVRLTPRQAGWECGQHTATLMALVDQRQRSRSPRRQLRIEDCAAVHRANKAAIHVTQNEVREMCRALKQGVSREATLGYLRRISVALHPLRGPKLVDTLRATGAGKTVQSLSRAKDKEVAQFATRLVSSWQMTIDSGRPTEVVSSSSDAENDSSSDTNFGESSSSD